ncbi:MAG TPA: hypothetical protein VGL15_02125 [Vicinamibacteria bacterium]
MTPSPAEAAREAYDHTRRDLFPFRFDRWLALGFVAFLDQCGRAGTEGPPPTLQLRGGVPPVFGPLPSLDRLGDWFAGHIALLMVAAGFAIALLLALSAVVLWVNSRAVFMYVDGVATGRADVSRPWGEHAERASSYFVWSFGLAVGLLVAMFGLLAIAAVVVLSVIRGGVMAGLFVTVVLALMVPLFVLLLLAGVVASIGLRDFVAPLQWKAGLPCGDAVRLLVALVKAYPGPFVVYLLLKIAFAIGATVVVAVGGCLTCCVGLLPIFKQTLFQPVFYFERAWSLHFLRQLGYDLVTREPLPPAAG